MRKKLQSAIHHVVPVAHDDWDNRPLGAAHDRGRQGRPLSAMGCFRVLGVDTSLRSTGVALIQSRGSLYETLEYELVKNHPSRPLSVCLDHLSRAMREIIVKGRPQAAALEGVFFCKNVKTAMILGEARGVVIAACASAGVPVYEYSPRTVKQAVVGYGNADKEQVRKMVMAILQLREEPHEDAADALAIALCHLHRNGCYPGLKGDTI